MNLRTIALSGVASLAGLGLVGAGAHAVFTTNTTSFQTVSAATPSVYLYATGTNCPSEDNQCTSITLPTVSNVPSTFDTTSGATPITIDNVGPIPVTVSSFTITDNNPAGGTASAWLQDEMNVCVYSSGYVWGNGTLTYALGQSSISLSSPITVAAGATSNYYMGFYAGEDSSACGASIGAFTQGYATPASLDNNAEGGSVTVTVTLNYTA